MTDQEQQQYLHEFSQERYYFEQYGEDANFMMKFDEACDRIENCLRQILEIKQDINNIK